MDVAHAVVRDAKIGPLLAAAQFEIAAADQHSLFSSYCETIYSGSALYLSTPENNCLNFAMLSPYIHKTNDRLNIHSKGRSAAVCPDRPAAPEGSLQILHRKICGFFQHFCKCGHPLIFHIQQMIGAV